MYSDIYSNQTPDYVAILLSYLHSYCSTFLIPSYFPSFRPSQLPTSRPSYQPTMHPSNQPTPRPTNQQISNPTSKPLRRPSFQPSYQPLRDPSVFSFISAGIVQSAILLYCYKKYYTVLLFIFCNISRSWFLSKKSLEL
jgi:hypothetical protein